MTTAEILRRRTPRPPSWATSCGSSQGSRSRWAPRSTVPSRPPFSRSSSSAR
ncbi:hypothetical protein NKG05_25875 [Oerskovia sp. M15]